MRKRLAILTTHPIQYHAPWFRALASNAELDLEVLYCHKVTAREQAAAGFGVEFDWDVPLFDGYPHRFLKNVAKHPSLTDFRGLDNPEINKIIENGRYDAVMVSGWHYKSAWQAMRACWKTKTPVMARSDSHLHTKRSTAKRAAKWPFYRSFIPQLDACLAVGKWSRDYFLHFGAKRDRVFIVPHAIDAGYFRREHARWFMQRDELRCQWGIDPNRTVFLFAGKFIEKKRPMDFVRAVHRASRDDGRVAGLMVGDGPLRAACEEFAKASKAQTSFAGFLNQSEITKAYVAADVLILPSDGGETWGLVVNEAMACGLPAIVSDQVGCGPDLIDPGLTGDLFPVGNIKRLAAAMSAWADPARCRAASEVVRGKIKAYSIERAADGVMEAMRAV